MPEQSSLDNKTIEVPLDGYSVSLNGKEQEGDVFGGTGNYSVSSNGKFYPAFGDEGKMGGAYSPVRPAYNVTPGSEKDESEDLAGLLEGGHLPEGYPSDEIGEDYHGISHAGGLPEGAEGYPDKGGIALPVIAYYVGGKLAAVTLVPKENTSEYLAKIDAMIAEEHPGEAIGHALFMIAPIPDKDWQAYIQ